MNNLAIGRFLSLGLAGLAIISSLSLNSCKRQTITEVDTVYVHDPDLDDSVSGWTYRQSGTQSGLVISQFASTNVGTVAGDNGTVLRTTDMGNTWRSMATVPSGVTQYGVWFFDANNGFTIDASSISRTSDGGASWQVSSSPSSNWLRSLCFIDRMTGFVGSADPYSSPAGSDGEIWRTSDGGITWNQVLANYTGGIYNIQFSSPTTGIATGKFGAAFYTTDAGLTWSQASTDQPIAFYTHTAFVNATTGFAPTGSLVSNSIGLDTTIGYLAKTTDGGRSWKTIMNTPFSLSAIATNGKGVVTAAGWGGNILESTDNGATWNHSNLGNDRWIDVSYANATRSVMIGSYGHIVTRDR